MLMLNAGYNQLITISQLHHLQRLEEVYLEHNLLSTLTELQHLARLEIVDVSYNRIKKED